MTNAFQRSWELTKLSFKVMKADKELFVFPILGGVFSILFLIAVLYPTLIFGRDLGLLVLFLIYLGLAFIATFFNTCAVYTIKTRFRGGNATFWESIKFSLSKLHLIFSWSIISATVGLILHILENAAERMEGLGRIFAEIIVSMLGLAWGIISAFVIPSMVYNDIGPFKALKKSVHAVKKTWGESLIRVYGLGLMEFIFLLIGVIVGIILVVITLPVSSVLAIILGTIAVLYIIAVITFFSIANTVFNTALYMYSEYDKVPKGYSKEMLSGVFGKKQRQ